jgi:hypothetical protein|eukprot:TRINITY_DN67036_c0_g1_i1.p1 TRINITY_DN67036_c0_g1~~TRINITY_DN67036_c0_g1_i1.p1  ORF type:complete len:501 (+),score=75.55 TRINITY_DN67036_c0_g1_i1:100-1602(+)
MRLCGAIARVAGLAVFGYGMVLDPMGTTDLLQQGTEECMSGDLTDYNFVDELLNLLNPGRENDASVSRTREDILHDWHALQRNTAKKIQQTDDMARRVLEINPVKVLIAQATKGAPATIARVKSNMNYLRPAQYGNFKWALFLYGGVDEWEKQDWYRESVDIVKREKIAPGGCEVAHMRSLSVEFLQDYDYVWLMDDDIDVAFLNWDLYATILASATPLVSQPSILAGSSAGRTTELEELRMVQASNGELLVAAERPYSEVMAPMIATKLWPAIHARAVSKATKCDSDLNIFWDILAFLGRIYCNITAITVVNAAPVSHVDCRTMPNVNSCFTDCERDLDTPISPELAELSLAACPNIPSDWLQRWNCDGQNIVGCLKGIRQAALGDPKHLTLHMRDDNASSAGLPVTTTTPSSSARGAHQDIPERDSNAVKEQQNPVESQKKVERPPQELRQQRVEQSQPATVYRYAPPLQQRRAEEVKVMRPQNQPKTRWVLSTRRHR